MQEPTTPSRALCALIRKPQDLADGGSAQAVAVLDPLRRFVCCQKLFPRLTRSYHGSFCPKLPLPAKTCQFLP